MEPREIAARIIDDWIEHGPIEKHLLDNVCYYSAHPAAYFTWAAEDHGYDVWDDKARKRSINALIRAEAKRRGLDWNEMKATVLKATTELLRRN